MVLIPASAIIAISTEARNTRKYRPRSAGPSARATTTAVISIDTALTTSARKPRKVRRAMPDGTPWRGAPLSPSAIAGSLESGLHVSINRDVTVVIACFNYGRYVGEAVASALGQEGGPTRVIVVNDGSDDPATLDVLDRLPAEVEVIHQDNAGPRRPATPERRPRGPRS